MDFNQLLEKYNLLLAENQRLGLATKTANYGGKGHGRNQCFPKEKPGSVPIFLFLRKE
jgi:hypothetical protein